MPAASPDGRVGENRDGKKDPLLLMAKQMCVSSGQI